MVKSGPDEWTTTGRHKYKSSSRIASMSMAGPGYLPRVEFSSGRENAPTEEEVSNSQSAALSGRLSQALRGAEAARRHK